MSNRRLYRFFLQPECPLCIPFSLTLNGFRRGRMNGAWSSPHLNPPSPSYLLSLLLTRCPRRGGGAGEGDVGEAGA